MECSDGEDQDPATACVAEGALIVAKASQLSAEITSALAGAPVKPSARTDAAARNAAINLRDAVAHRARVSAELTAFAQKHRDVHWQTTAPGRDAILAEYERIRGRMLAADRAEALANEAMSRYRP
jgi:hypothetical protein